MQRYILQDSNGAWHCDVPWMRFRCRWSGNFWLPSGKPRIASGNQHFHARGSRCKSLDGFGLNDVDYGVLTQVLTITIDHGDESAIYARSPFARNTAVIGFSLMAYIAVPMNSLVLDYNIPGSSWMFFLRLWVSTPPAVHTPEITSY